MQARPLNVSPSVQEIKQQEEILARTPQITGFGVTKPYEPPKAPDKPSDLPIPIKEWLDKSSATPNV